MEKVTYKNNTIYLNETLIKDKNVSKKNLNRIKTLHFQKMILFEAMEKIDDPNTLRKYDKYLDEIETELQYCWGFDYNPNFFKFWERPKCTCPKMDNEDMYPTRYCIINSDCPLHG